MSSSTIPCAPAMAERVCPVPLAGPIGAALTAGCLLALGLTLPEAVQVVSTGIFLNPDDAMRAVEVRDFMAGQPWFDLVPHRLSPDHPFVMHWSRLVDLPLAILTWGFHSLLPPPAAELAMRLAAPSLLFVAALRLMLAIVRDLIGPRAMLPAALLFAGSTEVVGNFIPGHIHHHAVQATLLLGAVALILMALRPPSSWRHAAGAGAVASLTLGIGLQNLPFVIGLAGIAGLAWVVCGRAAAPVLAGFGLGLAAAGAAVFAADVPPSAYGDGVCDAFSTAHLLAATAGGAVCGALALASSRLRTPLVRAAAAGTAALIVVGLLAACYPACLHDPMASVDPLLRDRWLADVGEALPLARLVALDWTSGMPLLLTLLCGLAATVTACLTAEPAHRLRWTALLLLAVVGAVGTAYQVRVAASACALLVPGTAWCVLRAFDVIAVRPGRPALLAATLVGLVGNGAAWSALAAPAARLLSSGPARGTMQRASGRDPLSCFAPAAYEALNALPPGLVLSTIDPGSAILAATPHSVLAAPYHRNTDGNRVALLAFEATPDAARALVEQARVTYVALCRASNEAAEAAARRPDGLAAALLDGAPPPWLSPLGTGREPILLFRVRRQDFGDHAGGDDPTARIDRVAG